MSATEAAGASGRLAIFVPSLEGGGAERMMVNLAAEFAKAGHSVDLVLAKARGEYLDLVPAGVTVVDLDAHRVLAALPALTRYLSRVRPRALLSAMDHANLVSLWARLLARVRTRVVISARNMLSRDLTTVHGAARVTLPGLARWWYPRADGIVAVSAGVADDLARSIGLHRDRIQVIYNPVVVPSLLERARLDPDHPWFAPGGPPVVLGAGRLTRQKDFGTLVAAFARLRATRRVRLVVIGEGEERQALQGLARDLGVAADVDFPGFVANPYAFLARCAVFALSSRWEGLPGVLIEALACGAKVVATDCPSGPREILDGGRFGALVPVGDADAMARALARAIEGEVPVAPAEALERFRPEAAAAAYLRLLLGEGG